MQLIDMTLLTGLFLNICVFECSFLNCLMSLHNRFVRAVKFNISLMESRWGSLSIDESTFRLTNSDHTIYRYMIAFNRVNLRK